MPVDSFKYLPRLIAMMVQVADGSPQMPIPWTARVRPLNECVFGLVTSGGLYCRDAEPPFDLERERQEPSWGDPTFRTIPCDVGAGELGASHLHINTEGVLQDFNILLPINRFQELAAQHRIGGLTRDAFSVMGYQGFPADTSVWERSTGPQIAARLRAQGADCVLLTPA